jgi:hypothetical protein
MRRSPPDQCSPVNPPQLESGFRAQSTLRSDADDEESALRLRLPGRDLPKGMCLSHALEAAVSGTTGPHATLIAGLRAPSTVGVGPGAATPGILTSHRRRRKPPGPLIVKSTTFDNCPFPRFGD